MATLTRESSKVFSPQLLWVGPRIMNLVYEMTCVLISWPFM